MQYNAKPSILKLPLALAILLVGIISIACKKGEKPFDIVGKWRVVSVQRQGIDLDRSDLVGRTYRFEKDGRCYIDHPVAEETDVLNYRIDEKRKILHLGGEDYQVYLAEGKKFTFGQLRNNEDVITYILTAD
ncbi:MAG: hypothetical protein CSA07_04685 [Bacteroidia bacterium]|nr:MAG: hypothetical protein CSA07_04685 [Bacteroidia bacterium]